MLTFDMLFRIELDLDNEDQAEEFMEELTTEIKKHLKENETVIETFLREAKKVRK